MHGSGLGRCGYDLTTLLLRILWDTIRVGMSWQHNPHGPSHCTMAALGGPRPLRDSPDVAQREGAV